jgi:drug/metabolite transporter (DMT)-like permease
VTLTVAAIVAFAANSVLCRVALRDTAIDAATFTTIRVVAGAAALLLVMAATQPRQRPAGSWTSAALLAAYAIPFSFAYTRLTIGTGALILFGSVQLTMLLWTVAAGERPRAVQWGGLAVALAGLLVLVFPGLTAPPWGAALLMAVAGIAWGVYSWRGRGSANPLAQTTGNFVRAVPMVAAVSAAAVPSARLDPGGAALAIASGAIASGLGYVAWYAALRGLSGLQASVVQLSVPVVAAAGGVVLLAEAVSARLIVAAIMVLGGIAAAIVGRD